MAAAMGECEQWKNHSKAWEGRSNEMEKLWKDEKEKNDMNGRPSNGINGTVCYLFLLNELFK